MLIVKQGKTNWKYILIVAVLAAITGGGILIYTSGLKKAFPDNFSQLNIPGKEETSKIRVKLYYYNEIKDREIADYIPCSPDAVLPVERKIPATESLIQDTIEILLQGNLTDEERLAGFSTEFPLLEFRLLNSNLQGGVLTLQFDDPMAKSGGGSCRVRLLWAQIKKTAEQFPEVKEVIFEPEFLFQP